MRAQTTIALLLAAALAGCVQSDEPADDEPIQWTYEHAPAPTPTPEPEEPPFEGVRFLAIGDQGTGGDGQFAVARTMERVCAARGCDFAVALGDNIYEIGATDAYDEQFETKFEQPYANFSIPFYMVQGNHDNSRDPISDAFEIDLGIGHWYATGDVEVDYHYRTDRTSEKWQMPARYYDFAHGPVTFFAMDTNLLMYYGLGITTQIEGMPTPGEQWAWLDAAVAAADTPWTIAIGHHPYISNGAHGNAGNYDDLAPTPAAGQYVQMTYEDHLCDKTDFFLNGHDHDMQWLEPQEQCGKTQQIVSGAAGKTRSLREDQNPAYFQQYDTYGFMWAEVTDTTFTGVFYDVDMNALFEKTVEKPAPAAA